MQVLIQCDLDSLEILRFPDSIYSPALWIFDVIGKVLEVYNKNKWNGKDFYTVKLPKLPKIFCKFYNDGFNNGYDLNEQGFLKNLLSSIIAQLKSNFLNSEIKN